MPPKASVATSTNGLTNKEVELLAAMATLMGDIPKLDYEELAPMVGQKYGKNARSSCRKLFEKLKNAHNVTAGPSSSAGAKSSSPEGDDSEAAEEAEEETPKKPAAAKKGSAKKATPKKTVGKSVTPKKASAGGPKTPVSKTKRGKKAKSEEVVEPEEDEDSVAAKSDSEDEKMKENPDDGKLPQSFTSNTELQPPGTAEEPLSMVINDEVVTYTLHDVEAARSHVVALGDYLIWKSENNYEVYLNGDQNA